MFSFVPGRDGSSNLGTFSGEPLARMGVALRFGDSLMLLSGCCWGTGLMGLAISSLGATAVVVVGLLLLMLLLPMLVFWVTSCVAVAGCGCCTRL